MFILSEINVILCNEEGQTWRYSLGERECRVHWKSTLRASYNAPLCSCPGSDTPSLAAQIRPRAPHTRGKERAGVRASAYFVWWPSTPVHLEFSPVLLLSRMNFIHLDLHRRRTWEQMDFPPTHCVSIRGHTEAVYVLLMWSCGIQKEKYYVK